MCSLGRCLSPKATGAKANRLYTCVTLCYTAAVSPQASVRAIVTGRVQGVGFRQFVLERAVALGLAGWVRNLPDGRSLEVQAEGARSSLETLAAALHAGPPLAAVERVEVIWSDSTTGVRGFHIRA